MIAFCEVFVDQLCGISFDLQKHIMVNEAAVIDLCEIFDEAAVLMSDEMIKIRREGQVL